MELIGKIVEIGSTQKVSDKFQKREFVVETKDKTNGYEFVNYVKFSLLKDKVNLIDETFLYIDVKVSFNIKGSKKEVNGETRYYTSLDAWKIDKLVF